MNKNIFSKILFITIFSSLFFWSCNNNYPTSIYDENAEYKPDPEIARILPDSAFAGVDTLQIEGKNFSTDPSKISVYFNGTKGVVVTSSETVIWVIPAKIISDSVEIKVSVQGALKHAVFASYKLKTAVKIIHEFEEYEKPYGITTDANGNIYFSLVSMGNSDGIKKLAPDGTLTDFSPKSGNYYTDLKYGPDNRVYGSITPYKRAIFASAEGTRAKTLAVSDTKAKFTALDFDNNSNIWTGGLGEKIFRIASDGSESEEFTFTPKISAIRFYNGSLYVAAKEDSTEAIWKIPISSNKLGTPEKYFDVLTNLHGYSVNDITFTSNGKILLGTTAEFFDEYSLVTVEGGKAKPWFPGVISGPVLNMTWKDNYLYYVRVAAGDVLNGQLQTIIRVNMKTTGAPYYGRD